PFTPSEVEGPKVQLLDFARSERQYPDVQAPLFVALSASLLLGAAPSSTDPELTLKPGAKDPRLSLLNAMAEELGRNQARLKLPDHPGPYFISYSMKDVQGTVLAARYGALFEDETGRERHIYADVRQGNYDFDSSIPEEMDINVTTKGTSYT